MRHVSATQWADLVEGRLSEDKTVAAEMHADSCSSCEKNKTGIFEAKRALLSLSSVNTSNLGTAKTLNWEHIGARIYWARAKSPPVISHRSLSFPKWRAVFTVVATLALVVTSWVVFSGQRRVAAPTPEQSSLIPTLVSGDVKIDGRAFTVVNSVTEVKIGSRIRIGEGTLWLQIGEELSIKLSGQSDVAIVSASSEGVSLIGEANLTVDGAVSSTSNAKLLLNGTQVEKGSGGYIVPTAMVAKSATLDFSLLSKSIKASDAAERQVFLDGLSVPERTAQVLVPLGRHLIEWTASDGSHSRHWVEVRHPSSVVGVLSHSQD